MNFNWQRVEELFHATAQLAAADRAVFLNKECGEDNELRREVESLVAASEGENSFIEEPALNLGMKILAVGQKQSLVGRSIGHYKIFRLLGEGGMGEVYLAEDRTLERNVALKFLSDGLADDKWAREQLTKEARAVARLENPNICAVYGLEQIGEQNFIVMQYVEGETLASLLRKEPLGFDRALDLAEQIAGALAAAHARGIIHSDVKPQNIVVTLEGQAKVLDFGLAKFARRNQSAAFGAGDQMSHDGPIIGTVAYMSPEQARGEKLDCRTDVFSFGIVLHEMFGGKNPFLRETCEETFSAIITTEPTHFKEPLPSALAGIGQKCLEKGAESRYETAAELLIDLRRLRKGRERAAVIGWRRYLQYYAVASVLLLLLFIGGGDYAYRKATTVHSLAVLPIVNESGDQKYLSDGLSRSLFDRFSYLSRLKVKMPTEVRSRQIDQIVQQGRELNVEAVLVGDVFKQDDGLQLHMRMLNTSDGKISWEKTFALKSADTFAMQDDITRDVTSALGMWLIGNEKKSLTHHQTDNQEALSAYMRGRYYWTRRDRDNIQIAIKYFDQAIDLDPSFAEAYAGLADCYVLSSSVLYGPMKPAEAIEKASYNARKAIELNATLPEAHTSMGTINLKYNWDWKEAERDYQLATNLDPNYAPARFWYANLLIVLGRPDDAIREAAIGKSLDPYAHVSMMNYARTLYYARRFDEAAESLNELLQEDAEYAQGLHMLAWVRIQQRRFGDAIILLEKLHAKDPLHSSAALGLAYGKAGKRTDALKMIQELDEFARERSIPPLEKALVHIGLGELDEAFEGLEQAYRDRVPNLAYLTTDPIYDDLRKDARFNDLARRVGLLP